MNSHRMESQVRHSEAAFVVGEDTLFEAAPFHLVVIGTGSAATTGDLEVSAAGRPSSRIAASRRDVSQLTRLIDRLGWLVLLFTGLFGYMGTARVLSQARRVKL